MEKTQPNYYAVVPANVRYCKELMPSAKLLYGEITALSNDKGYCWAGDSYFQDLYGVSKTTIQNWLKSLEKNNFINREVVYKKGSKEILNRYIRIQAYPIQENLHTPIQENLRDNTTSFNNTINNTSNIKDIVPQKKKSSSVPPVRHKYGEYNNVLLSDIEMEKLQKEFPDDWKSKIEDVSEYVAANGKKYTNFLAVIRRWAKNNKMQNNQQGNSRYGKSKRKETLPDWVNDPKSLEKKKDWDSIEEQLRAEGKL